MFSQRDGGLNLKRGACMFRYSVCGKLIVVIWRDNKDVVVVSSDPCFKREIMTVMRRDRKFHDEPSRSKELLQPVIVNRYIKWMRGVDLA